MVKETFTEDVIKYYKNNKNEITSELLDTLREQGNEGKDIALQILDIPKDEDNYYLDHNNNQISYKRIPTLKGLNTKLLLSDIHIEEIERCKDLYYYMNNYVKIVTKKGVTFPELRQYQLDFLDTILPDEHESIVGLLPRQCCSPDTKLKLKNKSISFEELFNECKQESKGI